LKHERAREEGREVAKLDLRMEDVLRIATLGGAEALGLGSRIGSLTPGKEADVIVVDTSGLHMVPLNDPVGALVFGSTAHDVETVIVGGTVAKLNGILTNVDSDRVKQLATEAR